MKKLKDQAPENDMNGSRYTPEEQEIVKHRLELQRRAEQKQIWKEVLTEWLDEKAQKFGYWSLRTIGFAFLVVLIWLILLKEGLHK